MPPVSKKIALIVVICLFNAPAFSHSINYALEHAPVKDVIWFYLKLGFAHIVPAGADHILFVVGLCLLSTKLKTILWQATAFTIAHSITLALSMKNIIMAPAAIVEPIIALSILFVALENIVMQKLRAGRIAVVFLFGLIHGMGFASSLNEIGLPPNQFVNSIVSFNAGVELGQVAVIAAVFALLVIPFRDKSWYRKRVVIPMSSLISIVALYWAVERIFFC
jgi:uncharacterized membrane protein